MRRTKRCMHGFAAWIPCRTCILLDLALARAVQEREAHEAPSLGRGALKCAVCRRSGHVAKHCMATPTGRRRLMQSQNPGLVEIERRRSILSRTQLDESEHLGRDEGAVRP